MVTSQWAGVGQKVEWLEEAGQRVGQGGMEGWALWYKGVETTPLTSLCTHPLALPQGEWGEHLLKT